MIKFDEILASATPSDLKFVSQRICKVVGLFGGRVISYQLTKTDVILAILEYQKRIHSFTGKAIRSEGMNYSVFKMHDLVTFKSLEQHLSMLFPMYKINLYCVLPF